ncbi:MAG: hydroxymethylglutaryl-CoA synthase [Acidobacteriota bacterium]
MHDEAHDPASSHAASPADDVGIASIGIALPSEALPVEELARVRAVDPAKYRIGLGCREIALCGAGESVVDLAAEAARRALERWGGPRERLGLLAVGTESAVDMSRPLSAWVADRLDLRGAVRSYEVKHACYGGTLALRQALEWRASGAARGQAALVVAADEALYEPGSAGEPTQGAGAVAFVVDAPRVASIARRSWAWSEPAFDFWRPVGEAYPRVDGPFSLDCYRTATERCVGAWLEETVAANVSSEASREALHSLHAIAFHVPFPKMVKKAVRHLGETLGWSEPEADALFDQSVVPTMEWNRRVGNCYTASLWLSVARALAGAEEGSRLLAFSYGSGFGAELLELSAGAEAASGSWRDDVDQALRSRRLLDGEAYLARRSGGLAALDRAS